MVPSTPRRIGWIVISAPWSCLHRSLCCRCEASSWALGLVSSQYVISIMWIWRAGIVLLPILRSSRREGGVGGLF
eukprot:2819-Pelagomonas_calceolata.AAC.1